MPIQFCSKQQKINKLKKAIVINARFLTQPITGVQRFAIEISKELVRLNFPVLFICPPNIIHKDIAIELNAVVISDLKGHLWEQISLPLFMLRHKGTLVSFCNTAPVLLTNQVVTIHDLSALLHPEWFSKSFKYFYKVLIPLLTKRSKHIITVSQTSKKELINKLSIPENKISVVNNAVFHINTASYNLSILTEVDYILTVSSHNPRKNFQRLIEAFNLIKDKKIQLLVVGNFNTHFKDATFILDSKLKERVVF